MAADTRPFKSKEQDGQGNEVIIRDQQLVEQTSQTTMASGEFFEIVDVDGRMAKIPKANMMSVVLEAIRLLLDDSGSNISAANLTKILGLSASSIGNILPTDLASVLGVPSGSKIIRNGNSDDAIANSTGLYLVGSSFVMNYINMSYGTVRQFKFSENGKIQTRNRSDWSNWTSWVDK